ncbi:MAG: FHA domain-containing protein [Eubacteriales bacterium]|nr:FHA domain-containing protein [Eubacteriales bacterium]
MRFVLLSGGKFDGLELKEGTVAVGRKSADTVPGINLEWDMQVSRGRHCLIAVRNNKVFIIDCGSKNGTFIGAKKIKQDVEYELPAGEPVKTGATVWMVIPAGWMVARLENAVLFGHYDRLVYYPLFHRYKFGRNAFYVINTGSGSMDGFYLKLEIPGFSNKLVKNIPRLKEYEKAYVDISDIALNYYAVRSLINPVKTALLFEIGYGCVLQRFQKEIIMMGLWDIPLEGSCWEAIAAYVSPFNDAVGRIVKNAEESLHLRAESRSFGALVRSGDARAEHLIFETIYEYLRENSGLAYEHPVINHIDDIGYQKIRPVSISGNEAAAKGNATCIDLSILLASCLERAGLCPLVILLGDSRGHPVHALTGCWMGVAPGARAVIDDAGIIREERDEGNIIIVESTGITSLNGGLAFNDALKAGESQIDRSKWLRAIDIWALHPPNGPVSPMDIMYTGEVEAILRKSEEFARKKKHESVELSHLLFGLVSESSIFKEVLSKEAGVTSPEVCAKIDDTQKAGLYEGQIAMTQNYIECIHMAEEFARLADSPYTREQDLWWAFLYKKHASAKTKKICTACGIDLDRAEKALSKVYTKPGMNLTIEG